MSLLTDAPERASIVYALPEAAHLKLVQLCEHLRLMVQLTALGSPASDPDARLRPDALGWWFSRLERDLDEIISASSVCFELPAAQCPPPS